MHPRVSVLVALCYVSWQMSFFIESLMISYGYTQMPICVKLLQFSMVNFPFSLLIWDVTQ